MRPQTTIGKRSLRRTERYTRAPSRVPTPEAASLQVFLFRMDQFVGTELFDGLDPISIGRHARSELRLGGDTVSRHHCRLVLEDGRVFVEDLGSGNGTFVNRNRVRGKSELRPTDALCVGPYTLKVRALRPQGVRPWQPMDEEGTTRIEAVLQGEQSNGSAELPVDLPGFDHRLYEEALRRKTGAEAPRRPSEGPVPSARLEAQATEPDKVVRLPSTAMPAATLEILPAAPGRARRASLGVVRGTPKDSTLLAAADLSLRGDSGPLPRAESRPDPEVAARLRDLDELIAALDAREHERRPSVLPYGPGETTGASVNDTEPEGLVADLPRGLSTREFARDLASRLAVDGAVMPEPSTPEAPAAALVAPPRMPSIDDEPTEAADADEPPETEVLDRSLPVPLPRVIVQTSSGPVPAQGPSGAPISPPAQPKPRTVTRARLEPIPAPVPNPRPAAPKPPPLPPSRSARVMHEARLMTPTSMRVRISGDAPGHTAAEPSAPGKPSGERGRVSPAGPRLEDQLDDVWTKSGGRARGHSAVVARQTVAPAPQQSRRVTHVRPQSRIDDFSTADRPAPRAELADLQFDGVEISARAGGRLLDIAVLRKEGEQYILGHTTPQGTIAPAKAHLGLRLLRINPDRTIDLVFPKEVGGHLVRGPATVTFNELAEGRKYSCLRLDPQDIATVILGEGRNTISYHVRFLRRPKSLFRSLRRSHGEG